LLNKTTLEKSINDTANYSSMNLGPDIFSAFFQFFEIPLTIIALLLILIVPVIVIYLFLRLSETAFEQIGFDHWHAVIAIFGSIIGSLVDIPLSLGPITSYPGWFLTLTSGLGSYPTSFNPFYLAINLGGAIVPMILSIELLVRGRVSALRAGIGMLIVAVITYLFAMPVANEGITLPFWLPPVLAAIVALLLNRGYDKAPALAYISGSMGTLIGADIFNLLTPGVLPALSPPGSSSRALVLSIGGAGVFDGIFLTGILAVLFAAGIVCLFHGSCEGVVMHRHNKTRKIGP